MQGGCPSRQSYSFPLDMLRNCNFLSPSISPLILLFSWPLFLLVSHIYIWTLQQYLKPNRWRRRKKSGHGVGGGPSPKAKRFSLQQLHWRRHIPSLSLRLRELEPFLILLSPCLFCATISRHFVCHNIVSIWVFPSILTHLKLGCYRFLIIFLNLTTHRIIP